MRSDLPSGAVTFLFTDVEGSTKLLRSLGAEAYAQALAEHRRIVRELCTAQDGVEVDTQGDAFFFAFPTASGAVAAAHTITEALTPGPIHLRIGLHTGTPLVTDEGYVGDDVHFAARVGASAHGGQVVLSQATRALVDGSAFIDLGEHRLKDIEGAVPIYQLGERSFPPLKTISNTNLPRPTSSFVGRARELEEVFSLLAGRARLLTLTGPGGSGKTRLAVEAAASLVPSYKAGVFWVGLATLRDPSLVIETVGQTLGASSGVAEHIGDREMLLVLDNLEQVIAAAPELSALLVACPNLTVLATSRELLRVDGEVGYEVPPLLSTDAVSLFGERSRLEPSPEIAALCRRLDDLPLAVELAAARTSALSPGQILERLGDRLDLLKGGRDADPRQQTLRATIAWSYELLSSVEQNLFSALSVFVGGCTLRAAEAVSDADLDTVQSLVEKSLVRFSNERYWMLETIREYAAEQLSASGRLFEHESRYVDYFRTLARETCLSGEIHEYDFATVDSERDNLRSALAAAFADDAGQALEMAGALGPYWVQRGDFHEARAMLDAALAATPDAVSEARARALRWSGQFALRQSELDIAERFGHDALRLSGELDDHRGAGFALSLLGAVAMYRNDLPESARLLEASLAEQVAGGSESGQLVSRANLAGVANAMGDHRRAIELGREVVAASRGRDDFGVAHMLCTIGMSLEALGQAEEARASFEESIAVSHLHGFAEAEAYGLASLAHLELDGAPVLAVRHYTESIALFRELADARGIAYCLEGLAAIALSESATDAVTLLGAAARIRERTDASLDPSEQLEVDSTLASGREALSPDAFDAAWSQGSHIELDEAIELALSSAPGSTRVG